MSAFVRHISGEYVDALPYVDQQYEAEELRSAVNKMIEEEMRSFKPTKDYLSELPAPEIGFKDMVFTATELERIRAQKPMIPMDISRYSMEPPPQNKRQDLFAWQRALRNAQSQIEHQYLRIVNLELLHKYGANTWRRHNEVLDDTHKRLSNALATAKKDTMNTNTERSTQQLNAGAKLKDLDLQWQELVQKNLEIDTACFLLEQDIKYLNAQAAARGLLKPSKPGPAPPESATEPPAEAEPPAQPTTSAASEQEGPSAGCGAEAAGAEKAGEAGEAGQENGAAVEKHDEGEAKQEQKEPVDDVTEAPVAPGTEAPAAPGTESLPAPGKESPPAPGTESPPAPGTESPPAPGTESPPAPGKESPPAPGTESPPAPGTESPPAPGTESAPGTEAVSERMSV